MSFLHKLFFSVLRGFPFNTRVRIREYYHCQCFGGVKNSGGKGEGRCWAFVNIYMDDIQSMMMLHGPSLRRQSSSLIIEVCSESTGVPLPSRLCMGGEPPTSSLLACSTPTHGAGGGQLLSYPSLDRFLCILWVCVCDRKEIAALSGAAF